MPLHNSIYYTDTVFDQFPLAQEGNTTLCFEGCSFRNIDFTAQDFSKCDFVNCTFVDCNLSMVKFKNVGLDHVNFDRCKLIGTDFSNAKDFLFHLDFSDCLLDYAAFMKKKNRKSIFTNCSLKGTDFTESDLTATIFDRCDLDAAVFMESILNESDFVSSFNFNIDPEKNLLRKAKFASEGLIGLLAKYGIIVAH